jgi:hypothetical protein
MRNFVTLLLFLICTSSCDFILGTQNLGDGYYFDTDEILYSNKSTYDGIGYNVIPTKVISYNKTDEAIIVSSMNNKGLIKYWIILKKMVKNRIKYVDDNEEFVGHYIYSNVIGPMDKKEFKEARKKYNIPEDLNLEPVNQ